MNIKYPVLMLTVTNPVGSRVFGQFHLREWQTVNLITFVEEFIRQDEFYCWGDEEVCSLSSVLPDSAYRQVSSLGSLLYALAREIDRAVTSDSMKDLADTVGVNLSFRIGGWALVVRVALNDFQMMEGMKLWGIPLEEAIMSQRQPDLSFSEEELDEDAEVLRQLGFNPPRSITSDSTLVPPSSAENG